MSEPIRREYLTVRVPCWVCSKPLNRLTTGAHQGLYVAAVRVLQGLERITHIGCTGKPWTQSTDQPAGDRSGRRIERAPRLDELDGSFQS